MKVYVDAWIYVTEKFVNMGNIELYEGVLRYEKADYPPIPNFIFDDTCPEIHYMQGFLPFYIVMLYNLLHCLFNTTVFINRIIFSI